MTLKQDNELYILELYIQKKHENRTFKNKLKINVAIFL